MKLDTWSAGYYLACGVVIIGLLILMSFFGSMLITPRDVSGTMFGGMFRDLVAILGWLFSAAAFIVVLVARLPGARPGLLVAGVVQLAMASWWRFNYPDDANGNLIFSPSLGEVDLMIFIACIFIGTSIFLLNTRRLRPRMPPAPPPVDSRWRQP